jgi:hypothetical protein
VTRGIPSDLASLNSVLTSGGASVLNMFNTSALYSDPLLDSVSLNAGVAGGKGRSQPAPQSGVKAGAVGKGPAGAFDTMSLKSQEDMGR